MQMNFKCIILSLSVVFSMMASSKSDAAEKITVSYSSRTYAFLPAQVAVAKGFFKDENLDPLLIQMRSQVTGASSIERGGQLHAEFRQHHSGRNAGHAV